MQPPLPGNPAPTLTVPTLSGSQFNLAEQSPENFTLVSIYRGYHCPLCHKQLAKLQNNLNDFAKRGVTVVALSCDDKARTQRMADDNNLTQLTLGYDLPLATAADWGLYLSHGNGKTSVGVDEPDIFCEPGTFLINPDGTLYAAWIQSTPFMRPHTDSMLKTLDFIIDNHYPARGSATQGSPKALTT